MVVVESDEQAIAYSGWLQDSDVMRTEMGETPFEIIDLRTGAPAAAHAGTGERIRVFLVEGLTDIDALHDLHLLRPDELALRVETTEEEVRADAILRELKLDVGDGNVTVIDLRSLVDTSGETVIQDIAFP